LELVHEVKGTTRPRKGEREGLNLFYKAAGVSWVLLGQLNPSLRINESMKYLRTSADIYEEHLYNDLQPSFCLPYSDLLQEGYLKKKHWVYADYMAIFSTLPLLYKIQKRDAVIETLLAKTAIGASTKLLDNLNDSVQSVEEALESLKNFQQAMIDPFFEPPETQADNRLLRAVNSAHVMAGWVPRLMISCNAPYMWQEYVADAKKLIQGQIDSITHRSVGETKSRTIEKYLAEISEKSIGDVWLDMDLCFMEDGLGSLDQQTIRGLNILREGYRWVFKASLIWDDAQDLQIDISDGAINSAILLAVRAGLIERNQVDKSHPEMTIERLDKGGIIDDTIHLADLLFIKGVQRIGDAKLYMPDIIDWNALLFSFRLIRLFNLRKILLQRKNPKTLNLFLSSLRKFDKISENIPDRILELERYI
jgi:hypothetical protein